jgi:hypothetical protein
MAIQIHSFERTALFKFVFYHKSLSRRPRSRQHRKPAYSNPEWLKKMRKVPTPWPFIQPVPLASANGTGTGTGTTNGLSGRSLFAMTVLIIVYLQYHNMHNV